MLSQTSEYGSENEELKQIVSTLHSLKTEEELTAFLAHAPPAVKQGLADFISQGQQSGEIKDGLRSFNDDKGLRDIMVSGSGKTHGVHSSTKPALLGTEAVDSKLSDDSNYATLNNKKEVEHDLTKVDDTCEKPKPSYNAIIHIFLQ